MQPGDTSNQAIDGGRACQSFRFIKAAAQLISRSGLAQVCAPFTGGMGLIFTMHRVLPRATGTGFNPNRHLQVTTGFLDKVLTHVRARGFEIVSLGEAVARVEAGDPDRPFCVFTLDDGYRDNLDHALPVFRRHERADDDLRLHPACSTAPLCCGGRSWRTSCAEPTSSNATTDTDPWRMDVPDAEAKCDRGQAHRRRTAGPARARRRPRRLCNRAGRTLRCRTWRRTLPVARSDLGRRSRAVSADPLLTYRRPHGQPPDPVTSAAGPGCRGGQRPGRDRLEHELGIGIRALRLSLWLQVGLRQTGIRYRGVPWDCKSAVTTRPGVLMPVHADSLFALPRVSLNGHYQFDADGRFPDQRGAVLSSATASGAWPRFRDRSDGGRSRSACVFVRPLHPGDDARRPASPRQDPRPYSRRAGAQDPERPGQHRGGHKHGGKRIEDDERDQDQRADKLSACVASFQPILLRDGPACRACGVSCPCNSPGSGSIPSMPGRKRGPPDQSCAHPSRPGSQRLNRAHHVPGRIPGPRTRPLPPK